MREMQQEKQLMQIEKQHLQSQGTKSGGTVDDEDWNKLKVSSFKKGDSKHWNKIFYTIKPYLSKIPCIEINSLVDDFISRKQIKLLFKKTDTL